MPSQPTISVKISSKADELSASIAQVKKQISGLPALAAQASRKTGQIDLFSGGKGRGYMMGLDRVESQMSRLRSGLSGGLGGVSSMARVVPGLGLVAGAASLGGLADMMGSLGGMGVSLKNTAMLAGTSAAGLNSLRGAARMVGLSADAADQAMLGLNHTITDAVYGRNTDAARTFQALGIDIGSIANGAKSAEGVLPGLVDAISAMAKTNPLAAERAAQVFNMGSALPLLVRGRGALEASRKEIERLYGSMDNYVAKSEDYTASTARMTMAGERLGMSIMTNLTPHVAPLLEKLADFTDRHNKDIGETFDRFGKAAENIHWSNVESGINGIGRAFTFATENVDLLTRGLETMAGTTVIRAILGNSLLGKFLTRGLIAHEALAAADPKDKVGSWIDRNIPGAAAVDDWTARHLGLGRTYDQQREADPQSTAGQTPATSNYQLKPVLDLIGRAEGTDRGRGYNETLGYGKWTGGDVNLTRMTLDQLDALQTDMLAKQVAAGSDPSKASSAAGRYQFTRTTLRELRERYGLSGDAKFDEAMQDRLVALRLQQRGGLTPANLANEWASLPDPSTGRSHYSQRTGATLDQVNSAIQGASSGGGSGSEHNIIVTLNNAPPYTTVRTSSTGSGAAVTGINVRRSMADAGQDTIPHPGGLY